MNKVVKNRKAGFNYEINDRIEAGAELFGFEVKALRSGLGSLEGAYVILKNGEVFEKCVYPALSRKEYSGRL